MNSGQVPDGAGNAPRGQPPQQQQQRRGPRGPPASPQMMPASYMYGMPPARPGSAPDGSQMMTPPGGPMGSPSTGPMQPGVPVRPQYGYATPGYGYPQQQFYGGAQYMPGPNGVVPGANAANADPSKPGASAAVPGSPGSSPVTGPQSGVMPAPYQMPPYGARPPAGMYAGGPYFSQVYYPQGQPRGPPGSQNARRPGGVAPGGPNAGSAASASSSAGQASKPKPKPATNVMLEAIKKKLQEEKEVEKKNSSTTSSETPTASAPAAKTTAASTSAPATTKPTSSSTTGSSAASTEGTKNVMLEALQKKLEIEGDSKPAPSPAAPVAPAPVAPTKPANGLTQTVQERQRKEAEAKRLAEEKLEKQRRMKEEEAKQKFEVAKKKQLEEQQRREEEEMKRKQMESKSNAAPTSSLLNRGSLGSASSSAPATQRDTIQPPSSSTTSSSSPAPSATAAGDKTAIPNVPIVRGKNGKIMYSFEKLMLFKSSCTETPKDLAGINFKLIAVKANQQMNRNNSGSFRNNGGYNNNQGSFRNNRNNNMNNNYNNHGNNNWQNRKHPNQNNQNRGPVVPPIKRSENAWDPSKMKKKDDPVAATVAKVKFRLNQLTVDNFEKISKEVVSIPMTSVKMLKDTMAAVFEKALGEPNFGELYADLCNVIVSNTSQKKETIWKFIEIVERDGKYYWTQSDDPSESDETRLMGPYDTEEKAKDVARKATDFRRILLNKCQEEFEKEAQIQSAEDQVAEAKTSLKSTTDEEEKKRLKLVVQEKTYEAIKIKRRVLGNVQFIGELFKKGILTERVMHNCIQKIMMADDMDKIPAEEELECLCKLLTTIGDTLAKSKAQATADAMEKYFQKLERMSKNKALAARHRFMILDLIDLRKNGWQARREKLKAKKIEDVHKDAQREETKKQKEAAAARQQGRHQGFNRSGFDKTSPTAGIRGNRMGIAGTGSMSAGFKIGQGQGSRIGGGLASQKIGGSGGSTGTGSKNASSFSGSSRIGAMRPGGSSRGLGGGSGLAKPGFARPPSSLGLGQSNRGRAGRPGLGRGGADAKPQQSQPSAPTKPLLDEKHMKNKINFGYVEYVSLQMQDELVASMKEVLEQVEDRSKCKAEMVKEACTIITEKKDEERRHIPKGLVVLFKEKILTQQDIISALTSRCEFLGDESIDSPLVFKYYADLFCTLIIEGALKVSSLPEVLSKFNEETGHYAGKFVGEIFKALKGVDEGKAAVKADIANLDIKSLLGPRTGASDESVKEFIDSNGFGDLLSS